MKDDTIKVTLTLRKSVAERLRGMCHASGMTASLLVDKWTFEHEDDGKQRPEVKPRSISDKFLDALGGGPFGGGPFGGGR